MKQTALITGASAGIGEALARLFAADGHDVILVARRLDRLQTLAAALTKEHGVAAYPIAADLRASTAPADIAREVERLGVSVDFLVNNAGFGSSGAFTTLPLGSELEQIQVNVQSLVHLTGLFVPGMVSRGRGRVLNVGSTAGFQPGPFMATYYATKAFVNSFSEALHFELNGTGVTVTVSCPGPVATEFAGIAGNDKSNLFQKSKVATPEEIAREAYAGMMKGKRLIVHGVKYRLMLQSLRISPRSAVLAVTAKINAKV